MDKNKYKYYFIVMIDLSLENLEFLYQKCTIEEKRWVVCCMLIFLERLYVICVLILGVFAIIFCVYVAFDVRKRILKEDYEPGFHLTLEKLKREYIELNRLLDE